MRLLVTLTFACVLLNPLRAQQVDLVLNQYTGQSNITAHHSITLKDGFHIPPGSNVVLSISEGGSTGLNPSPDQNYIMETIVRKPGVKNPSELENLAVGDANRSIQYFDGLGRPMQILQWQGSPTKKDIVQHIEYDGFGRESHQYLPYVHSAGNGSYKSGGNVNVTDFYTKTSGADIAGVVRTPTPYAVTVFESSSLNRVQEQGAPGAVWQPSSSRTSATGRTVVMDYGTNVTDDVRLWKVNTDDRSANGAAYYLPSQLYKTGVKDENWVSGKGGTVEEYRDFHDRVVLKRIWESETNKLETYYVYDDFGDLRYVIPPGYIPPTVVENSADFNEFVYAYRYDGRRRLIEKKIPGKGWEYIVYNKSNLPILVQDSLQRSRNEWMYTRYDAFGRITSTGIYTNTNSSQRTRSQMVSYVSLHTGPLWETRTGEATYPTPSTTFPTAGTGITIKPLIINYYDNYSFTGAGTLPAKDVVGSLLTHSLLTGQLVYRDDATNPLLTVYYYDDRGRLVQSVSQNHLGGTDYVTNTYNFVGEVLSSKREHRASPGGTATTVLTTNEYDHVGRLTETKKKVNSQAEIVQSRLVYNEIGELKEKKLHSENGGTNFINSTSFAYNERGWLTGSSSAHFTQELKYQNGTSPQYNGNIAEQLWGHASTTSSTFSYIYDKLNRLTNGTSTGTVMGELLEYDEMGNITKLTRDNGTAVSYAYTGNRLASLSGGLTGSYTYDANGNATHDRTGMAFSYNHLNLPKTAAKTGTSVSYVYDALGSKLRKTATVGSTTTQRDYVGGIEYSKVGSGTSTIEMIHTEEGYLQNNGGTYTYHYNLTDHLGNVRATVQRTTATTGTVIQKHDYYPFGKSKAIVTSGINRYLYNGKEIQDEIGGQYDYGARFYDAEIGRWNVVDPLAEQFFSSSPYNYVDGNPITRVDPDGRAWFTRYVGEDGQTLLNTDDGSDDVVVVPWSRTNEFMESVENSGRMLDDPSWNGNWKDQLGVAISGDLLNSYGYNRLTDRGQEAAIEYLFGSRGFGSFVLQEALGQWSDPTIALPALVSAAGAGLGSFQTLSNHLNAAKTGTTVLEGAVKSNYGRFVSKMPANAKSSATFKQLKDGSYLFEATSLGKVPGSSALYQKWVNPQGETFKMIKTTFAPDGSIIHVKPKF